MIDRVEPVPGSNAGAGTYSQAPQGAAAETAAQAGGAQVEGTRPAPAQNLRYYEETAPTVIETRKGTQGGNDNNAENPINEAAQESRGSGKTTYMHGQKFSPAQDEEAQRQQENTRKETAHNAQRNGAAERTADSLLQAEAAAPPSFTPGEDPYGDFAMPAELQVDDEILQEFKGVAAELRLDRDQAQRLVDLQSRHAMQQVEQFQTMRRNWVNEITSDPQYGGHRLNATLRSANAVLKRYDPQGELKSELNATGYGDNPKIIRLLARIGQDLQEDTVLQGKTTEQRHIPLRDRLWPDTVMP